MPSFKKVIIYLVLAVAIALLVLDDSFSFS